MSTHAFGTTFTWNSQTVGKLTAINGIEVSVDSVEVTTHQSANNYKEFVAGLIDAGEVSLEGNFDYSDTTGQQALLTDANSRTTRTGVITFPSATGTTWTFSGFVTAVKIGDAPVDGVIPFSATIKVTGKPTFAVATSTGLTNPYFVLSESAVITPAAAGNVYDYIATVLNGVTSITVTPTATAGTIVVTANGASQTVATGAESSAITLGAAGTNTVITITVTEANKAPKTYTIRVARAA